MAKTKTAAQQRGYYVRLSLAGAFVLFVIGYTWTNHGYLSLSLVVAAAFGAYMAINIGANDVANNVGPAVGARAMRLLTAVAIAAFFEAAGAIIAGGAVVGTVGSGIIDPSRLRDPDSFVWLMMAALLGGALWLNIATALGAPVSTTHSIVGGVLGAGIAASGWSIANWDTVGRIALSWVISPVLGGVIAALFLFVIKHGITYQTDMVRASQRMVPVLIGAMGWAFSTFLIVKGLTRVVTVDPYVAVGVGAGIGVVSFIGSRARLRTIAKSMSNGKKGVNALFGLPLIFAAALLSFAHGSNDVANAIGPLAAVYNSLLTNSIGAGADIPFWVMAVGALGLAVGLALYGPKLIKTVGTEITDMDNMRAYSIAMAAAVTVILASQLGLPISTTHVTIGAVFGIGFLREHLKANYRRIIAKIEKHHEHQGRSPDEIKAFLHEFETAAIKEKGRILKSLAKSRKRGKTKITKKEQKKLRKVYQESLVKRAVILRVVAAWLVTVPGTAVLSALIYYTIRGMLLP
ncbi:MAG: anion permease [Spirochaetaceae bacterium]|nr:MAG: anion permease [Spirochaetaceae bacterium]